MSLSDLVDCRARCERLEGERKFLADHCVVVIQEPIHFGDFQPVAWCTVCQVRHYIDRNSEKNKLIHRGDCLVRKVEEER